MTPPPDPTPSTLPPPDDAPRPQYEFTESQNKVIDDLSSAISWVGLPMMILGVVYIIRAVTHFVRVGRDTGELVLGGLALCGAVFFLMLASWLAKAAESFNRVTATTGYDVTHLMTALRNLGKTFGLLALLVKIYILIALIALVVVLVRLAT